jgi:uncharacterized protein YqjF (DUF2071 family)
LDQGTPNRGDAVTTETPLAAPADLRSHAERPLFLADWLDAIFIHFALPPEILQPHVPFPLDLCDGAAFVSLVAFTQQRLRPALGGRIAALLAAPLSEHPFLNLRTYVRVNGEPAIQFLAEWIPNRLAVAIGPPTYGLPYHLARLNCGRRGEAYVGTVECRGRSLSYMTRPTQDRCDGDPAVALDAFLIERYAAWTMRQGVARRFRIWHEPWRACRCGVQVLRRSLLDHAAPWLRGAEPVLAHCSSGVLDVWIGRPQRVVCRTNYGTWQRSDISPVVLL